MTCAGHQLDHTDIQDGFYEKLEHVHKQIPTEYSDKLWSTTTNVSRAVLNTTCVTVTITLD